MGDGAKLEDSNCAGIGSQADKELRESFGQHEEAWIGAGKQPGVEIWRIEKFEVKRWPEEEYGEFYDGDDTHTHILGGLCQGVDFDMPHFQILTGEQSEPI